VGPVEGTLPFVPEVFPPILARSHPAGLPPTKFTTGKLACLKRDVWKGPGPPSFLPPPRFLDSKFFFEMSTFSGKGYFA